MCMPERGRLRYDQRGNVNDGSITVFQNHFAFRAVSAVLAIGLAATSPALAQPYDYSGQSPYSAGPNETVTVIAPRFRTETSPLNGPVEPVSLSVPVHYTFHDLVDPVSSQVLRWKIWSAATDVCERLAEAYPGPTMTMAKPCAREAFRDAMARVEPRIAGARIAYWYGY
jgi:UrcA family protein